MLIWRCFPQVIALPLSLFKKGPARGEWYVATVRVEPSTASNYYGVSVSHGLIGGDHEQDIHWVPNGQPSFDVMATLITPFLRAGYSRARRPPRYRVDPLTVFECRVLHAARKQVFGEQIPLFWTPPAPYKLGTPFHSAKPPVNPL